MLANWTVRIERLALELSLENGDRQPVLLSVVLKGRAAANPKTPAACFSREQLVAWLQHDWSGRPRGPMLESHVNDVLARCFELDPHTDSAWVGLYEVDATDRQGLIGVERGIARREYLAQCRLHRIATQDLQAPAHAAACPA